MKDQFNQWARRRFEEYGFEDGTDFSPVSVKTRGRPKTDYLLTLDTAKEISMASEMTAMGAEVPSGYFDAQAAFTGLEARIVAPAAPWI